MTVIVSAFVPGSGFLLAADGRRHDGQTGRTLSDETQKIFAGGHPDCKFMFAWAGATILRTPFNSDFDFAAQTLGFCRDVSGNRFKSWGEFVEALKQKIFGSLIFGFGGRQIYAGDIPQNDVIAATELMGYFHGKPVHAVIKFGHRFGVLIDPVLQELCELEDERRPEIANLTGETLFQEIVTNCPESLPGMVKVAEDYIRILSEKDSNYGGRTHIATHSVNGFEWTIPPLNCLYAR